MKNCLLPTFRAFTCELKKIEIPRDIQEALRVPKWKEAVLEEMRALQKIRLGKWWTYQEEKQPWDANGCLLSNITQMGLLRGTRPG